MKYNPEKSGNHKSYPNRKSIRLKGYDYSQAGLYFITICVQNRECLFGKIGVGVSLVDNQNHNAPEMILNDAGKMIETEWLNLKNRFPNIELHEYVVMPNHFHGILEIVGATLAVAQNDVNAPVRVSLVDTQNNINEKGQPQGIAPTIAPTAKTIGDMMDAFKSITTVEYIRGVKNLGWKPFDGKLWQRNYYEIIVRDERAYQNISNYIINNPEKWQNDKFYKNGVRAALVDTPVRAALVDTQNNDTETGQPQGIAPTIAPTKNPTKNPNKNKL